MHALDIVRTSDVTFELAGVELVAAAGVREQPSMVLEGTGGEATGSCRFVEAR